MKTVKCICLWCKNKFDKSVSEYNRSNKKKQPHFCSLACSASHRNTTRKITPKDIEHLTRISKLGVGKNRDEYTEFRYFKRINATHRHQKNNLSLQDIKDIWDRQNGICKHTGLRLSLPNSIGGFDESIPPHKRASLDRIDNTKGYTKDNVHFVSYMTNLAKNRFDEKCVLDFIRDLRAH